MMIKNRLQKFSLCLFITGLIACSGSGGGSGGGAGESALKVAPAGVWVVNKGGLFSLADNSVSRLDASSNSVSATFAADGNPAATTIKPTPVSILFCGGSVWVGSYSESTLDRIDPTTNQVLESIDGVHSDAGMTCAEDRVWSNASTSRTVAIYDTVAKTKSTIELGAPGAGIQSTTNGVWVVDLSQTLTQFDPTTLAELSTFNINSSGSAYMPLGMTATSGFLWVVAKNNTTDKIALIKFDVVAKKIVLAVDLDVPGLTDTGIALGGRLDVIEANGSLWFPAGNLNSVIQVNPATGKVIRSIAVGTAPVGVTSGFGSIWVANSKSNNVTRINATTGAVEKIIDVGVSPVRLTVSF